MCVYISIYIYIYVLSLKLAGRHRKVTLTIAWLQSDRYLTCTEQELSKHLLFLGCPSYGDLNISLILVFQSFRQPLASV